MKICAFMFYHKPQKKNYIFFLLKSLFFFLLKIQKKKTQTMGNQSSAHALKVHQKHHQIIWVEECRHCQVNYALDVAKRRENALKIQKTK